MNCETIQETLEQGTVSDFEALEPHLETCASCAELAGRARESEVVLRQYLDDFADAARPNWEAATSSVEDSATGRGIHQWAIGLAIAAALLVAVFVQLPSSKASAGVADDEAIALSDAFGAIHTSLLRGSELPRAEEDAMHRAVMADKAAAFEAAESAWRALAEDADSERALVGHLGLGDLHESMGDALHEFDHPSYLTEEQSEVYARALSGKAQVQWQLALDAYEAARVIAVDQGYDADVVALDERLDLLVELMEGIERDAVEREQAADAAGRMVAGELRAKTAALQAAVGRCPDVDVGEADEILRMVVQAHEALQRERFSTYPDVLDAVTAYGQALEEMGCPVATPKREEEGPLLERLGYVGDDEP